MRSASAFARLGSAPLLILALGAMSSACIERNLSDDRFGCVGATCDAGISEDAQPDTTRDASSADALDAGAPDTGTRPDAGIRRDGGFPTMSCRDAVVLPPSGFAAGNTEQEGHRTSGACNPGSNAPEARFALRIPVRLQRLVLRTTPPLGYESSSAFHPVLYVHRDECAPENELACDRMGGAFYGSARVELEDVEAGEYYVAIDGADTQSRGDFGLSVEGFISAGERCSGQSAYLVCEDGTACVSDPVDNASRCLPILDCRDNIDVDGDGDLDEDAASCVSPPQVTCPAPLDVNLFDAVELPGSSSDSRRVVDSRWTLVSTPPGSPAFGFDTHNQSSAKYRPSGSGIYDFRFTAVDDDRNAIACRTSVTVWPLPDLMIELLWLEPHANLDLHVLSPQATTWFGAQDCFGASCSDGLEWGDLGYDHDPYSAGDVLMPGPDVIVVDYPESGGVGYRVGVFAHQSEGTVESARVRISCGGYLEADLGPVTLPEALEPNSDLNAMWKVADVVMHGSGCSVTPLVAPGGGPLLTTRYEARRAR